MQILAADVISNFTKLNVKIKHKKVDRITSYFIFTSGTSFLSANVLTVSKAYDVCYFYNYPQEPHRAVTHKFPNVDNYVLLKTRTILFIENIISI